MKLKINSRGIGNVLLIALLGFTDHSYFGIIWSGITRHYLGHHHH